MPLFRLFFAVLFLHSLACSLDSCAICLVNHECIKLSWTFSQEFPIPICLAKTCVVYPNWYSFSADYSVNFIQVLPPTFTTRTFPTIISQLNYILTAGAEYEFHCRFSNYLDVLFIALAIAFKCIPLLQPAHAASHSISNLYVQTFLRHLKSDLHRRTSPSLNIVNNLQED